MIKEVLLIALLACGAWFMVDSLRVRELALKHCARACRQIGVQFLDQTVAMHRLRLQRNDRGSVQIRRDYTFEYSDAGDDRHAGRVVMLGGRLLRLDLGRIITLEDQ